MRRSGLARVLLNAASARERKRILAAYPRLADGQLADEIRKICYASWTSKPTEAQRASIAANSLLDFRPDPDVRANAEWVSGISNITRGKFDDAVDDLTRARRLLQTLGRELDSAQTLVPTILALAILGRYDEAVKAGRSALQVFTMVGDDLAAGKIEMNLCNIAARRSRHREAERWGLNALDRFIRVRERSWQAMAENNLANIYMVLCDFRQARHFYARALDTARSAKMLVTEAEIEASMGNLAILRGDYAEALRLLELSRRKYELLSMPHQTAVADLEIADIYSTLNLNIEAHEIYSRVAESFRRMKLRSEEARSRLNFGRSATMLGNTSVAKREFTRSERLYKAEGNSNGQTAVMLAVAELEFRRQRFPDAVLTIRKARKLGNLLKNQMILANLVEGESLRHLGQLAASEELLEKALSEAESSEQAGYARTAISLLASLADANGDVRLAEGLFKRAIRLTEGMRGGLGSAEFSMAFLADKLDAYQGLAGLYLRQGRLEEAFTLTEDSRSRSLLDSMGSENANSGSTKDMADRIDDLRAELNWFYKQLDDAPQETRLRKEIRSRERKVAEMTMRIGSLAEKRDQKRPAFDVHTCQRRLGNRGTLIEYVERSGRISAFVVTGGKLSYVADLCRADEVAAELNDLQFQFGACRFGMERLGKFVDELKRRADKCLERLFNMLVYPLETLLADSEIIFIPSGQLSEVPFPALFDGEQYLTERFTVNLAPGAAVWLKLRERSYDPPKKALLVGFADERIPLVETEIDALNELFPSQKVLRGSAASLAAFSKAAPEFDLIHMACHGQFRGDNPMFSSLHLADGWVTARDISSYNLRASVVTLSACETGLSKIYAGDETLGLVRGFLAAGAASLIVSLWTVNDFATAPLMCDLYGELQRGAAPAASLQKAQISFIKRGEHPYLWAPFVAIGS